MGTYNKNCCSELREQFRVKHFGLHHDQPHLFIKPQCFRSTVYLGWSGFWFVFFFSMLMLDIYYNKDEGAEWLKYLTNLSYIVQSLTVTLDFAVTLHVHCARKDIVKEEHNSTPWYIRVLWVFCNVTNTMSILVTLLYYILLDAVWTHGSVNKHLLNSVYTLIALLFHAKPINLLHFYQPVICAILYLIFSVIYQVAGGGAIYTPLDWTNTGQTVGLAIAVVCVGVPVCHVFCFALHTFRTFMALKLCNTTKDIDITDSRPTSKGGLSKEVTARHIALDNIDKKDASGN